MNNSTDHISKQKLLDYINIDLFVDDMIEIDRHLDTCPKCQKQLERLQSKSSNSSPIGQSLSWKYLLAIGVLVFVAIGGFLYQSEHFNMPQKELIIMDSSAILAPDRTLMIADSSSFDSLAIPDSSVAPLIEEEVSSNQAPVNEEPVEGSTVVDKESAEDLTEAPAEEPVQNPEPTKQETDSTSDAQ
ncbi:MAG: hypothetical protein OCD76_03710 [Reichenbachiella sp.]